MYDRFEPFQQLNLAEFTFKPNTYEIWKEGQKISYGTTSEIICAKKKETENGTKSIVFLNENLLSSELSSTIEFDVLFSQNDRLQLLIIPSSGNGDSNPAINMFKMIIGETRCHTDFGKNEPYCCNLFFQNSRISKITFSFSSPEKLIEFY